MNNNGKIKTLLTDWLGYFITAALAIAYVMVQSVGMTPSGVTIGEILTTGALYFIVMTAMRTAMMGTGMQKGYASELWHGTANKHEEIMQRCLVSINLLPKFLEEDYQRRLKMQRVMCLRGVAYEKIFNDDGTIKDYTHPYPNLEKLNKQQQREKLNNYNAECRSIRKARQISVPLYRSEQLFTRSGSNKRMFSVSPKKTALISIISGLVLSVGTTVINLLFRPDNFNLITFLSSTGMALVAVALSLIPLHQGYTLITQSLREDVIDKIHYLSEFEEWAKQKRTEVNYGQQN